MNFGTWHELADAPGEAPREPGVLQARSHAPRAYPRGKSAMVWYGASDAGESLQRYVAARGAAALGRAAACGARLVRFGVTAQPEAELDRLVRRFEDRFGAAPVANQPNPDDSANDDDGASDAASSSADTTRTAAEGAKNV